MQQVPAIAGAGAVPRYMEAVDAAVRNKQQVDAAEGEAAAARDRIAADGGQQEPQQGAEQ